MRVSQRGTPSEAMCDDEGGCPLVLRLRGSGAPQPRREPRPGERSAWGRMLDSALGVLRRTGILRKRERAETCTSSLTKSAGKRPAGGAWDHREAGEQAKRKRQWAVSDKQLKGREKAAAGREAEQHTFEKERRIAGTPYVVLCTGGGVRSGHPQSQVY